MSVLYAQTSGNQSTNSATFVPIPGLSLTLPEGANENVLVIVDLPNPYAQGNNYPGGNIGISVNGSVLPIIASFTYGIQNPPSTNRMPTTLVAAVPLTMKPQTVQAVWGGIRGSTVIIDSPASLSVII